jgi:phage gpG-like protein
VELAVIGIQVLNTERVISGLNLRMDKVRTGAKSALDAWAYELAGYIKANKLSGSPLNRRSGRLSSSVHAVDQSDADKVSAGAAAGAGVPYAKIHEYGGTINHPGGTAYFVSALLGRTFFVSNASAIAASLPRTQPHSIEMPERSYMRSGLRDKAPDGISALRAAVKEAIA